MSVMVDTRCVIVGLRTVHYVCGCGSMPSDRFVGLQGLHTSVISLRTMLHNYFPPP